jgi:hypothetical protein
MGEEDGRDRPGEDRRRDALLPAGSRAASAARAATSPPAVEATLASISDEVMEEAIARRDRVAASVGAKTLGRR